MTGVRTDDGQGGKVGGGEMAGRKVVRNGGKKSAKTLRFPANSYHDDETLIFTSSASSPPACRAASPFPPTAHPTWQKSRQRLCHLLTLRVTVQTLLLIS